MAEEGNEDSWLYGSGERPEDEENGAKPSTESGDSNEENSAGGGSTPAGENGDATDSAAPLEKSEAEEQPENAETDEAVPNPADEMEEADREEGERMSGDENSESEEDDDDINVVIGDIKSGPNYNIKQRGNLIAGGGTAGSNAAGPDKDKSGKAQPGGKFNMEEFESIGTINGAPAHEFSIDSLDEKPWRKPGADITDYFNYGFNEDTWRMYCERQKRMRQNESGVGLQGLMVAPPMIVHNSQVDRSAGPGGRTLTPIANDNSKYGVLTSMPGNRRAGPPPGRRMTGAIDVIGGNGMPVKQENVIQVMTAERREYSRPGMPSGGKFDMPPPPVYGGGSGGGSGGGGSAVSVIGGGPGSGPGGPPGPPQGLLVDAFEDEFSSYGYEPTQDSQWGPQSGNSGGWAPTGIKELTSVMPQMVPAPMGTGMAPGMGPGGGGGPPSMQQQHQPPPMSRYPPSDRPSSDRDRSMRGERSSERVEREPPAVMSRDRDRERSERSGGAGGGDKEKDRSRSRNEREQSRSRRDRSRSRERSRRRSRSREKTRDRERASGSGREKKEKKKDEAE